MTLVDIPKGNVIGFFSGTESVDHSFTQDLRAFGISNDHTASLSFAINAETVTVLPGEVFEDNFQWFKDVSITATGPFRAWGRG